MSKQATGRRPVTVRVARWSATHPWRAIALWLVFVAGAVAMAAMVPTQQVTDADTRVGESGRAAAMITEAGLAEPDTETVLIGPGEGSAATLRPVRRQGGGG